MSFDKPTRNRLAKFVSDARGLIADEFTEQFQSLYGISAKGEIAPLDKLGHLDDAGLATAALLRERIDYLEKTHPDDKDGTKAAVARLAREQAFTILNRLAAIRMAEKRGLIVESVGQGYQSKGFKVFETVAGSALGDIYYRYRRFLFCLFDELAIDLGILFDRRSPQALLFPREAALLTLLDHLHASDLERLWAEDETIGWIYQYYNDPEERKKMRKESSAPRNSRELAVRNQFFTPRYVVEFLTDNTLGRIWYEMTKGETRLAEQCRYLVRRPTEIFLVEGESAPETPDQEDLTQEEQLHQPVFIPHRPLKDPREIRLLDPACGSMHFGLYAFDLFETIYEESWAQGSCPALLETYASKEDFIRDVPRLIIEHNIHGIDIDPRATQIAALSLWLRAQKAWQQQKVPAADRPRVRRSNIVCAEPMPGSPEMLEEFVATLNPPLIGELVKTVFDKMQLAGEAGSLLKIEEEIRTAIDTTRKEWLKQQDDLITRKDGSQEEFFDTAEQQVIDALRGYAEQADADSYQRRFFADDAARGFAFIDLCRKRYDAVVMNPPFGEEPIGARSYISSRFTVSKSDVGMAFIECLAGKLDVGGRLGAITNRVFIANDTLEAWRDAYLFGGRTILSTLVDLGYGVLDDAKVEAAAYVVHDAAFAEKSATIVRVLDDSDKEVAASKVLSNPLEPQEGAVFFPNLSLFGALPGHVLAYQLPNQVATRISQGVNLTKLGGKAAVGLQPSDDFRFVRLVWEVGAEEIGRHATWVHYAKGGEYQPYWDDIHLLVNWRDDGVEIKNFYGPNGKIRSRPQNLRFYFRKGVTWPERTTSDFSPRVLPENCIFSVTGQGIFCGSEALDLGYIVGAYARAFKLIIDGVYGSGDASSPASMATHYRSGVLSKIPPPIWNEADAVHRIAKDLVTDGMKLFEFDETSRLFCSRATRWDSLFALMTQAVVDTSDRVKRIVKNYSVIDSKVFGSVGFDEGAVRMVESLVGPNPGGYELRDLTAKEKSEIAVFWSLSESDLIRTITSRQPARRQLTMKSYIANRRYELVAHALKINVADVAEVVLRERLLEPNAASDFASDFLQLILGHTFGRWDIRYATGERQPPELPDPFDPLPVCPPGMLQNAEGLPAEPKDVPGDYPLRISWPGILVDDENHPEDIVARVREAIEVIWKDRAEAIEQEACGILGVKTLRDYFRRPAAFFADHLKRYSKSRRQAPIYWPLSTKSGSYTLWLYYHRLTDQTLHTCLADFLDPKIRKVQSELDALTGSGGSGTRVGELREFLDELKDLRDEIERVVKLPWKPNLNDGVLITASPLWKLFRLPKWQKDLKACWDKLAKGEYDWAHLAYSIRPREVEKACEKDRSIAIAHGLEHLCKIEPPKPKKKRVKKAAEEETEEDEPQLIEED
jgi:hypothetical protein